jgi:hypothetical protein
MVTDLSPRDALGRTDLNTPIRSSAALPRVQAPEVDSTDIVTLVVSVDTEEDNWVPTRSSLTARNVLELPRLEALFRRLGGVRATYFTTYAVVQDPEATAVMRSVRQGGFAEIGAHLHPWNTPPITEPASPRNTMLKNLGPSLQLAKLRTVTAALERTLGVRPRAFRAGRYGLGPDTVAALIACGYQVDSSVTPFVNWEQWDDGPNFIGAPPYPYRLAVGGGDVRTPDANGALLELPLSCSLSRGPFRKWGRVWNFLNTPGARRWHLASMAARLGVVHNVMLNPELASPAEMLSAAHRLLAEGLRYLHLTLHSPSLQPGLSPFVGTQAHRDRMLSAIEAFISGLATRVPLRFATVSEAAARVSELTAPIALGRSTLNLMPRPAAEGEHRVLAS